MYSEMRNWGSVDGVLLGYGLDERYFDTRWGAREFSPPQNVQTDSEAHPASYSMGTEDCCPADKVAKAWSWPLIPI
jgi:hypothetical protein